MHIPFLFWLMVAIITALVELGHPGLFYFLSFAVGACITAVSSWWVDTISLQLFIFIGSTIISCILLRYLLAHYIAAHAHYRSNIHALIGKHALVTKPIKEGRIGSVKVGGEVWTARALDDTTTFNIEDRVIITQISGAHLKVQKHTP